MQQTNSFDDDLSGAAWSDAVAAGAGAGSGSGSGLGPGAGAGAAAAWTADFGAPRRPAYDTFDGDGDSDSASAAYRDSARDSARDAGAGASSSRPRQPVITKSHQLSHITSIFTDAQKMAYVGLCYLEIHRRGEARLAAAAGGKHAQQSYHEWADRFMRMLYAFLDVSEAEQQMIANLALHGLIPSDLSRTLLDDAAKALERLQKLEQEQAWIAEQEAKWMAEDSSSSSSFTQSIPKQQQQQESNNVSDIRFTILSHLFILCICDGFYDSRSRSLLRAVARHLEIDWWSVAKLEDTISEQLRIQDSESNENESVVLESSIVKDRNKKDSQGRWLYMGLATLGKK
ncbi:hypothetical protein BDR26DRAFT_616488 [Obelidium mucronatum]|nr:hypothetical protein BDR26DRAFT_616488 [Obelidium mucronatum]